MKTGGILLLSRQCSTPKLLRDIPRQHQAADVAAITGENRAAQALRGRKRTVAVVRHRFGEQIAAVPVPDTGSPVPAAHGAGRCACVVANIFE